MTFVDTSALFAFLDLGAADHDAELAGARAYSASPSGDSSSARMRASTCAASAP